MNDLVARYRAASEACDLDALMETLSPDIRLVSPISGRMVFRGHDDMRVLLEAIYGSMRGLHWTEEIGDGATRVIIGEGRIGPLTIGDAMVFELADDGRIRCIRPHLRPWLALTVLAVVLVAKLSGHPGLFLRALRPS